jgi:hypothetical protein
MIGRTIAAYVEGVKAARAGRGGHGKAPPTGHSDYFRTLYVLGWEDETRRMAEAGRLAQYELPLGDTPSGSDKS